MENNFLPIEYAIPNNSRYLKIKNGENTFRILSSAIVGYEYWTNENKPIRSKTPFQSTSDIKMDKEGNPTKIKHFWAFVVWNYDIEAIQIFEITQTTLQTAIKGIVDNKKWGNPKEYDITIKKTGEGMDTKYSVVPNPHSDIDGVIMEKYQNMEINLEALYSGDNPFKE